MTDINGPTDLKGRMVGAISGGMDGEIPAKATEKEHGAFKSFKGYAGYAEMFADMEIGRIEEDFQGERYARRMRRRPGSVPGLRHCLFLGDVTSSASLRSGRSPSRFRWPNRHPVRPRR